MGLSMTERKRLFWVAGLLVLASFPWLPGGDPLNPVGGARGYAEFALTMLAGLLVVFWWPSRFIRAVSRFWWLLLPGVWSLATAFWSADPLLTLGKALVFLFTLLVISALALSVRSLLSWAWSVVHLLILLVVLGLVLNLHYYGNVLHFGDTIISATGFVALESRQRLVLATAHPLVVGHLFALLGLFSLVVFSLERRVVYRWLSIGLFGLGVVGVLLADARASLVSLLIAPVWGSVTAFLVRMQLMSRIIVYMASFVFVILFGTWISTWEDFGSQAEIFLPDIQTLNGRIPLWQETIYEVMRNSHLVLFGTGFGVTRFLTFELADWNPGHTHNGFLEILAATGLLGVAFFFPIIVTLMLSLYRFPLAPLALYLLLSAFFNPTLQGGFVFSLVLITILIREDRRAFQNHQAPHPLPAAGW